MLIAVFDSAVAAALRHDVSGQPVLDDLPHGVCQARTEAPRIWLG